MRIQPLENALQIQGNELIANSCIAFYSHCKYELYI